MNCRRVYILGGCQTDFQRNWTKEGKNIYAMMREIVNDTLEEVDIDFNCITQLKKEKRFEVFIGNLAAELYCKQGNLGALITDIDKCFYGIPAARYEASCASGSVALGSAITKIRFKDIDVALVIGIELMKSVDSKTCGDYLGTAAYYEKEANGIEYPFPKLFGKLTEELIKKYKLDENRFLENLAEIASINYSNAKKNPNAQTRFWFMNKEHANYRNTIFNKSVGGKLCISDCSQITDGAVGVVLVSYDFLSEYFKKMNIKNKSIPYVKGCGVRVAPFQFNKKMSESKENPFILPWTFQSINDSYECARLSVKDMDVFETHDCFTVSEYVAISHFGLTNPGEEYKAIESGSIKLTGCNPINPSGGLIGVGHPVGASGVRMFLDLYKQVSNKANDYQVENARNGIMLNIGGTATTNYTFIIGK